MVPAPACPETSTAVPEQFDLIAHLHRQKAWSEGTFGPKAHSYSYGPDLEASLLQLLEPETSSRFVDNFLSVPIDASHLIIVACANRLQDISAPMLNRFNVIELSPLTRDEREHILRGMANSVARDLGVEVREQFITELAALVNDLRAGKREIETALARCVRNGIDTLNCYRPGYTKTRASIGFISAATSLSAPTPIRHDKLRIAASMQAEDAYESPSEE